MTTDNKKEWLLKARIDYYAPFMNLWFAFNSWYRSHYPELSDKGDRELITKVKSDDTARNPLFTRYKQLLSDDVRNKDVLYFKSILEQLYFALENSELNYRVTLPEKQNKKVCFSNSLIDYKSNDNFSVQNIIKKSSQKDKVKLDSIFITSQHSLSFSGIIEMIYQARCELFHGSLEPNDYNHELIKYCYYVLLTLLEKGR